MVDGHINLGLGKLAFPQEKVKPLPVKALPLTSPVKPLEQQPGSMVEETAEHPTIVGYTIVVVVTQQLGPPYCHQLPDRHIPVTFNPGLHSGESCPVLLATGFPLYPEFTSPAHPAVVGKTQEFKDSWFTLTLSGRISGCKPAKVGQFKAGLDITMSTGSNLEL